MRLFNFFKRFLTSHEPNAAQAWQQAGNEADSAYWLYAAPVHLVLQRDSFSLAEPAPLPLESDEADTLTNVFNRHFASDGMQFFWYENTWFLRISQHPQIDTVSPKIAINQDIAAFLPAGDGATQWASFQNEVQMLLFEHPINQVREAKRMPAINSIWCYGGGQMETKKHAN